jgi:hypothetical protein
MEEIFTRGKYLNRSAFLAAEYHATKAKGTGFN